jgi:hypothetical protein
MIELIAAVMVAAAPLPPSRVRIDCPFTPIFFDNGRREMDEQGLYMLATSYNWVLDRSRDDVRIVLRTSTREPDKIAFSDVSHARAEAVRAVLIADGIPADHIFVAHDFREGPNFAPEGWVGGWVYLDFYVSPSVMAQIMPRDGTVC